MILFSLNFGITAQDNKGIQIGQTVPDLIINNIHNYRSNAAKISDFKGKLLIIDFWTTYCGPCISMIPKMDSLQKQFRGKVQFISVTDQKEKIAMPFLESFERRNGKHFDIPVVCEDSLIKKLFPHTLIPHFVWIGTDGLVKVISSEYYVTTANIKSLIEHTEEVKYVEKKDIDTSLPLYLNGGYPRNMEYYSIFLKGLIEGTGSGTHPRKTPKSIGMAWTNATLIFMYSMCAEKVIPDLTPKRIILEACDSSKLFYQKSKLNKTDWYRENMYSVDCVVPLRDSALLYSTMLANLNRYTGYQGTIEKRRVKYLSLYSMSDKQPFKTKGDVHEYIAKKGFPVKMRNVPIEIFVDWLNRLDEHTPTVINNTQYVGKVDIDIQSGSFDLASLKNILEKQGLGLKETTGEIDMLIIHENKLE